MIASHDDLEMEEKAINLMLSNKVDGLILNTKYTDNLSSRLEGLRAQGFLVVLLSGLNQPLRWTLCIQILLKVRTLPANIWIQMGHGRIIFVAGADDEAESGTPSI